MIYLKLKGRLGNQLFMYAFARSLQIERGKNEKIIIDDIHVHERGFDDFIEEYNTLDVEYIHDKSDIPGELTIQRLLNKFYYLTIEKLDYVSQYKKEEEYKDFFTKLGYICCQNGYLDFGIPKAKNLYLEGYFQSEKYFAEYRELILKETCLDDDTRLKAYPGIEEIKSRNSVCITAKVDETVGNKLYEVYGRDYFEKAIEYITQRVDNPLFFVCSDNTDYIMEHYIDGSKYDVIFQDMSMPANITLAAMSKCKHFIVGTSSFSWWAQYLGQYEDKIVVAPSKWVGVDMPVDIYQDNWHLIEV